MLVRAGADHADEREWKLDRQGSTRRTHLGTMPAWTDSLERQRGKPGELAFGGGASAALAESAPRLVRRDDLRPHGHDAVRQHESRRAPDAGDQARPRAHRHAGEPRRRFCGCRIQRDREPADLASRRHAQSPAHTRHRPADDGRRQRTDRAGERVLAALRSATVRRHRRRGQRAGDLFDPCRLLPAGQASEGDRLHELRIHVGHRARVGARRNPDRGARDDG